MLNERNIEIEIIEKEFWRTSTGNLQMKTWTARSIVVLSLCITMR